MDYHVFKEKVLALTGIDLNAYKENQMKRRIDAMIRKNNCQDYESYLGLIKKDSIQYEAFINYLTINVSEFFRNPQQWQTLEKEILPMLLQRSKTLKIWSAACSSGDEPYSLAMLLSRMLPLSQIQILATDLDKDILAKAKEGRYTQKYIENVPADLKTKFFTKEGDDYVISNEIKKCITFKQHNLLKDPYPQQMDLIICRNVLIYFTEEAKDTIYHKMSDALKAESILFVGSTEQIIGSQKYQLMPYRIFFYQKK